MRLVSSVLFAAVVLAACDNPVTPASDLITARGSNQTLQITNTTSDRVYYMAAEQGALALLDWAVCLDPANTFCKYVAPHGTTDIAYSQIVGSAAPGAKVVVYHWRLVPANAGKYQADSIRHLVVPLE
jgi:hypothetical protein